MTQEFASSALQNPLPCAATMRERAHGIRLFHAERQPLRKQSARRQSVRLRHHATRRSTPTSSACTRPGSASTTSTRSACCPCPDLVLSYIAARTKHIRLAPAVDGDAAAPSDPCRRAMGDARPSVRRPRRFRRRPRLRRPRIRAVPYRLQGQPEHLRGRYGGDPEALGRRRPHLAPRQALQLRRRPHHAEADPESAAGLYRLVLQTLDRACRAARLRPDRRAVCRRDQLRRAEARSPTSTTRPASSTARSRAG